MSRPFAIVLVALVATFSTARAEKISPRADALDLVVVGVKPVRIEIRVEIGGQSVHKSWDETFAKLHAYHDRNGDGVLDATEAARLPSTMEVRAVLWGFFYYDSDLVPKFRSVDRDGDGKVRPDELADYYRQDQVGGVTVGIGIPAASAKLTDVLWNAIDANGDGKIDEAEMKAAATTLRKRDTNDDELIGPGELIVSTSYPGATGSMLFSPPSPYSLPNEATDELPLIVLPLRTDDTHWVKTVAERRRQWMLSDIKPKAIAALRTDAPEKSWNIRLTKPGKETEQTTRVSYASETLRFDLRTDEGKLKEQTAAARKRLLALFAECDSNRDRILNPIELAKPMASPLKQISIPADCNGDRDLSEAELKGWFDLQEQISRGHALVTILDHGAGLFEFLDHDRDGSLSVRELRTAWDRLKAAGCTNSNGLDRTKLPRQLIACVSHGHPVSTIGKPVRTGPKWFLAMDRNADGDVSPREWVGDPDLFRKSDTDGDGLLSAEEAAAIPRGK
jgi:Ca2+-binding EF-hand superfamily protein